MTKKLDGVISGLFYLLFFFVPIVLFPKSSELFELNKMVLVYTLTILIVAAWFLRSLLENRIRFKRTMLDIPLVLFLISQVVSTATSIDQTTSIFGYYGRFHGGLLSSFAYALLYWAYVSNMDKQKTIKSIKFLLTTAMLVSIYAILQRFGIDDQYWSQDVKARVFSTLGQPNWLAAWIVSLMPLAWTLILSAKYKVQSAKSQLINQRVFLGIVVSIIFFLNLLFTKSRSGFLGFAAASVVFWGTSFWINRTNKKLKPLMIKSFIILKQLAH